MSSEHNFFIVKTERSTIEIFTTSLNKIKLMNSSDSLFLRLENVVKLKRILHEKVIIFFPCNCVS